MYSIYIYLCLIHNVCLRYCLSLLCLIDIVVLLRVRHYYFNHLLHSGNKTCSMHLIC